MICILLQLLAATQLTQSSSIFVDWSVNALPSVQHYILDYAPPVGNPSAGSTIQGTTTHAFINGTIPASEYQIYVTGIVPDGSRRNVSTLTVISGPEAPQLDSIETTEHEATISYFPPSGNEISYYIEYYPAGHEEYANVLETKASLVRLRGLDSGTTFRIKIKSIFRGIHSIRAIDASFTTAGAPSESYDYTSSSEFSVRTLPPDFNLVMTPFITTTSEPSYYEYSKESSDEKTGGTSAAVDVDKGDKLTTLIDETSTELRMSTLARTTSEPLPEREREEKEGKEIDITHMSTHLVTSAPSVEASEEEEEIETTPRSIATTTTATSKKTTTTQKTTTTTTEKTTKGTTAPKKLSVIDTGDYGKKSSEKPGKLDLSPIPEGFNDPDDVSLSDENEMLRLDWNVPESTVCDAFLVNYTILTLNKPQSFSVATSDDFALIKMFNEHTLDIRVFCMLAGALSKTWWARRIAYLAQPRQVEDAKITHLETDEFYVASMRIEWKWPEGHNFELYKIVVEYGIEKGATNEIEVTEETSVLLDKLEPAQQYIINIKNVSTELTLESKPVEIRQITPPLISSTVYPGQISSTAINVNFGESDPEQGRFDHYILTFSGNNKNITKKLEISDDKSLTFTKLIPGKTYHFAVYTVYKGVKSRPVIADITTYPLKVNQLYPVVGKDYCILYWDIENFGDSDVRFRLSHNADKLPTVSVDVKGTSRHRFGNLKSDTYYTFTITVIMGAGKNAQESESEMVTVAIPKGQMVPKVQRQGTRELVVSFENEPNVFTVLNGAADNFAVIVSDNSDLNDDNYELRSWFEVKDEEEWGSYRASPSTWNPFTENIHKASFTVGTDDCVKRSLEEPYCNGILRANVKYRVKVRMYTDTKVAMETDWASIEGFVGEEATENGEEEEDGRFFFLISSL
ncbi:hypothetical protein WR25_16147 isoform E [Diploscapter pachys]|uniref:protein-tyrosine-phosphatase n=1 Tax=Diploscapter pachys TaxID=2018661 RepID=A0A2A2L8Z9_9BILA|nr:hypothetical protein WR25_16147 isoform E [Diploscapter pachys]